MAIIYPDMYRNTGRDHTQMATRSESLNVTTPERVLSVAGGTFLLFSGLKTLGKHPVTAAAKVLAAGTLLYRGISGHCPVYDRLHTNGTRPENINIKQYFTVNRPRTEVYQFWRRLANLSLFMRHIESVEETDATHSHWKARFKKNLPAVSWNAEIVKERENEFIGWQSVKGSTIDNAGKVEFRDAPGGRGTEVQVVFSYHAPLGGIGDGIARLFNPIVENIIREDVRNFKQFIETGEIPTIEGQSSGRSEKSILDF
jgi:uncharacterized membrane protein